MTRIRLVIVLIASILAVLILVPLPLRQAQAGAGIQGPIIGQTVTPVSIPPPSRAAAAPHQRVPREIFRAGRRAFSAPPSGALAKINDPARQTRQAVAVMPSPIQNFKGLDFASWGDGWPPDSNGDVGPNHYVEMVNTSVGIFSKTGTLLFVSALNNFFSGTNTPCDNFNQGDVVVIYDHLADRWVLSDFAWSSTSGPFYECVAISKTGDPVAGGWWLYAIQADASLLNDYPKLALWPDAYYLTASMFNLSSGAQNSNRVWALNRAAMLNGQAFAPIYFEMLCGTSCGRTVLPSNLRGALPPAGSPNFLGAIDPADTTSLFHLWKFHVDWTTPSSSTLTGPTDLAVAPFAMPCFAAALFNCVPEQSGELVDGLGDRLMMPLQYRNLKGVESLWANHTIADSSALGQPTGIRWYEIRNPNAAPVVYQQGTFQPDSNYRWMGSLAVDGAGNMALGYSVSSDTMFPAIRYAGRLATDPLGVLLQGETSLIEGTGSQFGGFNRWGDYTSMRVDPTDDCTFWYVNEYFAVTGQNWQTRIGSFRFPSCGGLPPIPPPAVTAQAATATPRAARCEDAYEPDDAIWLGHTITGPELHNFSSPKDEDWVNFKATANWIYQIKADPPTNTPTEPHLELYVDSALVAQNDHAFGNIAEIWWWNNGPDRTVNVRVTELKSRGECGNSQYTLSVKGYSQRP